MSDSKFLSNILNVPEEIFKFLFELFEIYEVRAMIDEVKGIKYEVRTKEQGHNRPHIHVSYGEFEISISIDQTIEILNGKLPLKQQKRALQFVNDNILKIRGEWNNIHINMELPFTNSALALDTVRN